jgi:hypothetical protein
MNELGNSVWACGGRPQEGARILLTGEKRSFRASGILGLRPDCVCRCMTVHDVIRVSGRLFLHDLELFGRVFCTQSRSSVPRFALARGISTGCGLKATVLALRFLAGRYLSRTKRRAAGYKATLSDRLISSSEPSPPAACFTTASPAPYSARWRSHQHQPSAPAACFVTASPARPRMASLALSPAPSFVTRCMLRHGLTSATLAPAGALAHTNPGTKQAKFHATHFVSPAPTFTTRCMLHYGALTRAVLRHPLHASPQPHQASHSHRWL